MLRDMRSLFSRAAKCRACPGMGCPPVLSPANGPATSRIVFVGEAPGRFGAGRTGVPFSGDVAGARFERLLSAAGLRRDSVFVTNSVLCLPIDQKGRNRTPRRSEVTACSAWLANTISAIEPEVVIAMGRVALEALRLVEAHRLGLDRAGETPIAWSGRHLGVVYHPGARSQAHRSWTEQMNDWERLGSLYRQIGPGVISGGQK